MTDLVVVPQPGDHFCGLDGELWMCIERRVYGPCEHRDCGGVCEYWRDCDCPCHRSDDTRD